MENKIYIVPDVHCRDFYKPVLNIKDKPVVFLGDYMDPYDYEGFTDKHGIENLQEIIDFARNNKNVTLLVGNHKFICAFDEKSSNETRLIAGTPEMVISSQAEINSEGSSTIPEMEVESSDSKCLALNE